MLPFALAREYRGVALGERIALEKIDSIQLVELGAMLQFTVRSMLNVTAVVAAYALVFRSGPTRAGFAGFAIYFGLIGWALVRPSTPSEP